MNVSGSNIKKVEYYDNSALIYTTSASPYDFTWPITSANNGAHSITAKVFDLGGSMIGSQNLVNMTIAIPSGGDLFGWAWASNIGWINMNCTQANPSPSPGPSPQPGGCNASSYKVTVDNSGDMTGWAWSPNLGWIKFGGLAGNSVGGNLTTDANVDLDQSSPNKGKVTGWIRACGGTVPGDCSSMNSRVDGWDGWIELSGNNHTSPDISGNSGVTMDPGTGKFNGYAWGGPVMGWINFMPSTLASAVFCPGCAGGALGPPVISSCDNSKIAQAVTLPYTGASIVIPKNVAVASGGAGPVYQFQWNALANDGGSTQTGYKNGIGAGKNNNDSDTLNLPTNSSGSAEYDTISAQTKDSAGKTMASPYGCGTVRVAGNPNVPVTGSGDNDGNVHLYIGGAGQIPTNTSGIKVKQGSRFALKWTIPDGATCNASISGNGNSVNKWTGEFASNNLDTTSNPKQIADNMTTSRSDGVTLSKYTFSLTQCTDNITGVPLDDGNGHDPSVDLQITQSSVIEI